MFSRHFSLLEHRPYYTDNTILGEHYARVLTFVLTIGSHYSVPQVTQVNNEDEWTVAVHKADQPDDPPPGGWLTLAMFHVLWHEESVKVLPAYCRFSSGLSN